MSFSIHDIRFFNFAVIDIIGTIIAILIIYHYRFYLNLKKYSLLVFVLGALILTIGIHYILKVDTTLNYILGLSNKPIRYKNKYKIFDIVSSN